MASTSTLVRGLANTWEACQVAQRERRLSCCKDGPVADAREIQHPGSRRWWAHTATTTPLGSSFPSLCQLGSQTTFKSGSSPFYTLLYQQANFFLCAYINNAFRWASSRALSHSPKWLGPKEVNGLHRAANELGP